MVVGWIVAAVVIIGVGSSLAGEFQADYDTPNSESKAASDLTKERFDGYSGQEIYAVWKAPGGVDNAAVRQQMDRFFAQAEKVEHIGAHTPIRVSENGKIATTTLPMDVPGWEVKKKQGEELIDVAKGTDGASVTPR